MDTFVGIVMIGIVVFIFALGALIITMGVIRSRSERDGE